MAQTRQNAPALSAPLAATRFLAAVTISWYGDWLTTVGLVVVLYTLTGSAIAPAGYVLARVAPRLLGPTLGGSLADRHQPAVIAASLSLLQAVAMLGLIVATTSDSLPGIYAAVIVSQFLGSMVRPCHAAMFPSVASPQGIRRLNTFYSASVSAALFIAPAVGTLILNGFGVTALFQADLVSFVLAGALFITLPRCPRSGPVPPREAPWAGVVGAWHDPVLRAMLILFACGAGLVTVVQATLVVAAADRFGGSQQVGFLYAAVGAGGVVGVILVLVWHPRGTERRALFAAAAAELVATVALAAVHSEGLAAVALFLSGCSGTLYQTWGTSYLQEHVLPGLLGRISGAVVLASYAGMLVGAVASLVLVVPLGWSRLVLCAGAASLLGILAAWRVPGPGPQRLQDGALPGVTGGPTT